MRALPALLLAAMLPALNGNTGCGAPASGATMPEEPADLGPGDASTADHAAMCAPVAPLTCGEFVAGDTSDYNDGATDVLDNYPLAVGNYSGPEIAYWFDPPTSGEVTLSLIAPMPTEVNHDLFVLDASMGCSNAAAIARGFNEVTFEADPGHRYYLVVDGYAGDEGLFGARLQCSDPVDTPPAPDPEPELGDDCAFGDTIWETMGSPYFDWRGGVEVWSSPAAMPPLARDQLEVGWERFAGSDDGMDMVWDLVNADGVRMDELVMDSGARFEWIRFELRAGARFGFIFREGTTELMGWNSDDDIQDCRIESPAVY
jgi:hypothetical protein